MSKRGGYIKLFRSLASDSLWTREEFSRGQAWVDLLMLANYRPGHLRVRGNRIALERGQIGWSAERLAKRWKWSRGKVNRFLNELENEQQIEQQKSFLSTVLTLTNYERYQKHRTAERTENSQQTDSRRTADGTADGHQSSALSKKNNTKKENKNIRASKFQPPSAEEVAAYCHERQNGIDAEYFLAYYETRGWKTKSGPIVSWKHAVITWEKNQPAKGPRLLTDEEKANWSPV